MAKSDLLDGIQGKRQSIDFPADLTKKLQKLQEFKSREAAQDPDLRVEVSFQAIVIWALRQADRAGLLDPPQMADPMDHAIAGLKIATDRAKSSLGAHKPKK